MKHVLLLYLAIIFQGVLNFGFAQTVFDGRITDRLGKPVSDASVMLLKTIDSTVVAYNFSNDNGEFRIIYTGSESELLLMVYGFNIRKHIQKIKNITQIANINVVEEAIKLAEFSVKSEKIWGSRDTVNYIVDAFRDSIDLVIADVLRKMPGIEVKESGKIEYRGKPIKKFYIENMDMLQGRYGIVTNNISASDIATVQVFENHQDIKALQDVKFSDDAAINLKLKPGAKGVFSVMDETGAGYNDNLLWNNEISGMYFGRNKQHITSFQTNNIGNDPSEELQSYTDENEAISGLYASMIVPSPPAINKTRYYFNKAFSGSINNLIKISEDAEFTFNLDAYHDYDDRESTANTYYYLPGSDTLKISETMNSHFRYSALKGGIGLNKNTKTDYLNSRLTFRLNKNDGNGSVIKKDDITQIEESTPINMTGNIHWIKRGIEKKNSGIEVNSNTMFISNPYSLKIEPGVFANELTDSISYNKSIQDIYVRSFTTRNSAMLLNALVWNSFVLSPILLASFEHQALNSKLITTGNSHDLENSEIIPLKNDIIWNKSQTGASLILTYRKRKFDFEFSSPVQYQAITLYNKLNNTTIRKNNVLVQPFGRLKYTINSRWEMTGSWLYYSGNPSLHNLYTGYILQNYRTLSRYDNRLSDLFGHTTTLRMSYKDIMQFLFTSLEVNYNKYRNEILYSNFFNGEAMTIKQVEMRNTGYYLGIKGNLGKGFNWEKLSVNAEFAYGMGSTPQLVQDSLITYKSSGTNANVSISMSFTDNILFSNKASLSNTKVSLDKQNVAPIKSLIEEATLIFSLNDKLLFSAGMEYYYSRSQNHHQSFFLLDAGIIYKLRRVRFSLDYNNILNTAEYIYAYNSSLGSFSTIYKIRPASVMLGARFKLF